MYSGFVTKHKTVTRLGIHQRYDMAAYKMIATYLPDGVFPTLIDIIHFEGYNGPDGLKIKSRGQHEPSHLYDPISDTGDAVHHIASHYAGLVKALKKGDHVRSAFEASWMAHYICDGLTPAHHWPLEDKVAEAAAQVKPELRRASPEKVAASIRKNWEIWGAKGHMSTHFNFEMGVAFALMIFPIKPVFTDIEMARASELGAVEYFKSEARDIASLNLYDAFYRQGWTTEIATVVKNKVAPQGARTIGIMWLLAVLEAGQDLGATEVLETS
jgi:hypothetical protein